MTSGASQWEASFPGIVSFFCLITRTSKLVTCVLGSRWRLSIRCDIPCTYQLGLDIQVRQSWWASLTDLSVFSWTVHQLSEPCTYVSGMQSSHHVLTNAPLSVVSMFIEVHFLLGLLLLYTSLSLSGLRRSNLLRICLRMKRVQKATPVVVWGVLWCVSRKLDTR